MNGDKLKRGQKIAAEMQRIGVTQAIVAALANVTPQEVSAVLYGRGVSDMKIVVIENVLTDLKELVDAFEQVSISLGLRFPLQLRLDDATKIREWLNEFAAAKRLRGLQGEKFLTELLGKENAVIDSGTF